VRFCDHIGIWVPAGIRIYVLQKRPGWERDPVICQKIQKLQAHEVLEDESSERLHRISNRIAELEGRPELDAAEREELRELEARLVWEQREMKQLNAKAASIAAEKS
jgi:hypothetical protein